MLLPLALDWHVAIWQLICSVTDEATHCAESCTDTRLYNECFPSERLEFWNNQAEVFFMSHSNKNLRCQVPMCFVRWNCLRQFSHFDCWTRAHCQMFLFEGNEPNEAQASDALHSAWISFLCSSCKIIYKI